MKGAEAELENGSVTLKTQMYLLVVKDQYCEYVYFRHNQPLDI